MSRIGKQVIKIPQGVKVEKKGSTVSASGPVGRMQIECHPRIDVEIDTSQNLIKVINIHQENRKDKELHGTMRSLIAGMVTGVSKGFKKQMEIYGTGYNLKEQGSRLVLQVGFCHPVEREIPEGIKVDIQTPATRGDDVPARFSLSGVDKHMLGQFAANIRSIRPPEPYKGKGIRYTDERIRRKVGKAFASGGA